MAQLRVPNGGRPAAPPAQPKKSITAAASAPSPEEEAKRAARIKSREDGLASWLQLGALACISRGWVADVGTISTYGQPFSHETAKLGEQNEQIAKGLDFLAMTGPYSALLSVTMPFVLQLAVNHGKISHGAVAHLGVVAPEMMESKARVEILKMQAEAEREQRATEQAMMDLIERERREHSDRQQQHAAAAN